MAINPGIWYSFLDPLILFFWCKFIHFILFVKKNQVMNLVSIEILLDRLAEDKIKITNIFRH